MQCFFGKAFKLGLIKYNSMNKVFSVISHMYVCQAIRVQTTYVTVIQYIIMQRLLKNCASSHLCKFSSKLANFKW